MDKTIHRVTDLDEQQVETYRYWQSRPVGECQVAVCELTKTTYAFAAAFKGWPMNLTRDLKDILRAFNNQAMSGRGALRPSGALVHSSISSASPFFTTAGLVN